MREARQTTGSGGARRAALVGVPGVSVFVDDDAAYLAWLRANPGGLVVNAPRSPASEPPVLHVASCGTISGEPARGRHWTDHYLKACATSRMAIQGWSVANAGRPPRACGICAAR